MSLTLNKKGISSGHVLEPKLYSLINELTTKRRKNYLRISSLIKTTETTNRF